MGWFDRSLKHVMKATQKRHSVPLNRAKKLDDKLQNALIEIQRKHKDQLNNEGVQLQAATRYFFSRVTVVKQIERDLVSMGEDVAVQEKVLNQLTKLKNFSASTWSLMKTDYADTIRDFKRIKKKWSLGRDAGKVREYILMQEKALRDVIARLAVAEQIESMAIKEKTGREKITRDVYLKIGTKKNLPEAVEEAKALLAKLLAAKAATTMASDLGVELQMFWEDLNRELEMVTLPPVDFIGKNHKKELEEMRGLIDQELASIMMALNELNKEIELFEGVGAEIVARSVKTRIRRALSAIA